jgi:hypothetical protein
MNFGYVTVNGVNSNVFSITRKGETADIQHYLDEHKISEESQYDGLYSFPLIQDLILSVGTSKSSTFTLNSSITERK